MFFEKEVTRQYSESKRQESEGRKDSKRPDAATERRGYKEHDLGAGEVCPLIPTCVKWGSLKTWFLRNEPKLKTRSCEHIHWNVKELQLWKANFYLGSFWKTNPI
jgi:hypothetical protein